MGWSLIVKVTSTTDIAMKRQSFSNVSAIRLHDCLFTQTAESSSVSSDLDLTFIVLRHHKSACHAEMIVKKWSGTLKMTYLDNLVYEKYLKQTMALPVT